MTDCPWCEHAHATVEQVRLCRLYRAGYRLPTTVTGFEAAADLFGALVAPRAPQQEELPL